MDIQEPQREGESGVTRSVIDEVHSWGIHGDQMACESSVTRNIKDELHFPDIE